MTDPSYYARLLLKALLCRYPHRLSLGALTGIVLHVILKVLSPFISGDVGKNLSLLGPTQCAIVGVFLFVFPTIFSRHRLSDDLEEKLVSLRRIIEEGNLSPAQRRLLYLDLAHQVLNERQTLSPNAENDGTAEEPGVNL